MSSPSPSPFGPFSDPHQSDLVIKMSSPSPFPFGCFSDPHQSDLVIKSSYAFLPPPKQPNMLIKNPFGLGQQLERVINNPFAPRQQPERVIKNPFGLGQQPEMVFKNPFGLGQQPERVFNNPFAPRQQPELLEINKYGTEDSEMLDRSTPESTQTFQVNSVNAVGIPPSWNEDKVKEAFKDFGDIERVVLARKRKKITAIKYTTQEGALSCIASFSKKKITNNGRKVNVHVSLAKPEQKDKRIERMSRPRKKSKLNEKADECVATSTSASASVPSTTTAQASSSTLVDSKGSFTTSASLEIVREPIMPSEIIRETVQEERTITHELETRILQNRDVLTKIEAEFEKVVATRTHLVNRMYLMEDHQEKIVEALESMERVMEELLSKDHDATQIDKIPWITRRDMEVIVEDMNATIYALYSAQGRSTTLMDVAGMILEEQLISLL